MRTASILAATVATLALAQAAHAQDPVPLGEFSAIRLLPAPGPLNYYTVDGAGVGGDMLPSAGLYIDFAYRPFTLYTATCDPTDASNCEIVEARTHLVEYVAAAHILGSFSIADRIQIGLVVPLAITGGDRLEEMVGGVPFAVGGYDGFAIGDPELSVKARLYGDPTDGIALAVRAYAGFPIGQLAVDGGYVGDATIRPGGDLIAELGIEGFHLAVNIGGFWREKQTLFSTVVGWQLTYAAAVGYDFTSLLSIYGEIDGGSSFDDDVDENPLEGRLAVRLRQGDFTFQLGGGAGIVSGVGVPLFRVLGGLTWAPIRHDSDADGILDGDDACPSEAEDIDEYFDEDGCPEADNDNDGLLDGVDPCPTEPEDRDGHEDDNGCPDPDNDGDGVDDGYDSCPEEREDMDGDRDEDGCPDDDTDRDGVPDGTDRCPTEPEDTDGYGDEDGCPEADFDGDTITDDNDVCPDQPEIMNGVEDQDGCPEEDSDGDGIPDTADRCPNERETLNGRADDDGCPDGDELVRVEGQVIRLMQQVQFRTNSARITGARSLQILDAVATILRRNPQYQRVRVEGHTDDRGNPDRNRTLSMDRAGACIQHLVRRGNIAAERLYAQGHGPDRPIGDNTTAEGRAANRRTEFHIEPVGPGSENVTQTVEADAAGETD